MITYQIPMSRNMVPLKEKIAVAFLITLIIHGDQILTDNQKMEVIENFVPIYLRSFRLLIRGRDFTTKKQQSGECLQTSRKTSSYT